MTKKQFDQWKKDGKAIPVFWTIEVLFNYKGDMKRWPILNQTGEEVMNFRNTIFQVGFNYQITPTHSEIIFPYDLREILLDLQKKFEE